MPEYIRTKTTKESPAEAKKNRELSQLATEQEQDAFSDLTDRKKYWTVFRTCAWIARFVHNVRNKVRRTGLNTTEEIAKQRDFGKKNLYQTAKHEREVRS